MSVRVLPEPAPATTSNGPSRWVTASSCAGLSSSSYLMRKDAWRVSDAPRSVITFSTAVPHPPSRSNSYPADHDSLRRDCSTLPLNQSGIGGWAVRICAVWTRRVGARTIGRRSVGITAVGAAVWSRAVTAEGRTVSAQAKAGAAAANSDSQAHSQQRNQKAGQVRHGRHVRGGAALIDVGLLLLIEVLLLGFLLLLILVGTNIGRLPAAVFRGRKRGRGRLHRQQLGPYQDMVVNGHTAVPEKSSCFVGGVALTEIGRRVSIEQDRTPIIGVKHLGADQGQPVGMEVIGQPRALGRVGHRSFRRHDGHISHRHGQPCDKKKFCQQPHATIIEPHRIGRNEPYPKRDRPRFLSGLCPSSPCHPCSGSARGWPKVSRTKAPQ